MKVGNAIDHGPGISVRRMEETDLWLVVNANGWPPCGRAVGSSGFGCALTVFAYH